MVMVSLATAMTAFDLIRKGLAAAIEVRDFNAVAAELSKLNDALISAQGAVIAQNSALFALQEENLELAKKLAKLEEAVAQRGAYVLVQLSPGVLAYRIKSAVMAPTEGDPSAPEPDHFACQDCLDNRGHRVVLQRSSNHWSCNRCKAAYWDGTPHPDIGYPSLR